MKTKGVVLFGLLNKLVLLQKRCHSRENGNPGYFNKGLDSGLKPAGMTNSFLRSIIVIAVILFLMLMGISVFAGTIDLPQTGQTKCYSGASPYVEIPCAGTGQDGEIQAGVAWPSPRFTVGTGAELDCVTDNLTGLMWARNGNLANGGKIWQGALDYIAQLNSSGGLCGYTDWVLPNVNELESLGNANVVDTASWLNTQGFYNVQSYFYWSSNTFVTNTTFAWDVQMWSGSVGYYFKDYSYGFYVLPVRSGQTGIIQIPKTGQTTSYYTGDDGDLERGAAWPEPRFTVNGDCVTDNLTGLMWTKNANLPNGTKTWQEALDYANNLILCGYTEWRLPNKNEIMSLIDRSKYNPALPTGHPFTNVQWLLYWSSTTSAYNTSHAWFVEMGFINVSDYSKDYAFNVWPVRAGQTGELFDYYCDNDNDGYINSSVTGTCTGSGCIPAGCQTTAGTDCNDYNGAVFPGAPEVCDDDIDNNCNGVMYDCICIAMVYFRDADGDGYGNSTEWISACPPPPSGYVTSGGDCDDGNSAVHPGAAEITNNGIDDDCNSATPVLSASGSGNNYPVPLFRASLSLNVNASSLGTSTLSYYYTRNRLYFVSTSITNISVTGGVATITGSGKVNNVTGYTFTATVTDGVTDAMGLEIRKSDGTLYHSTGTNTLSTGNFTVTGQ